MLIAVDVDSRSHFDGEDLAIVGRFYIAQGLMIQDSLVTVPLTMGTPPSFHPLDLKIC